MQTQWFPSSGSSSRTPILAVVRLLMTKMQQNDRMPVPVIGVHHLSLKVDDLAAARQFYGDVLGLIEIERPDFTVEGAWFPLGTSQLHLGVEDGHLAPVRQHFAVLVADLDSAVATIEAHGVSVRSAG